MSQTIGTVNVTTGQSNNPQTPAINYDGLIGTVGVQNGQTNPKVPTINYGGARTLKGAVDLSLTGVQDNYVITYQLSTDSFIMKQTGDTVTNIDEGFF